MSKVIGPFRHTGSLGTLSGGTFIPARSARDAIRPKPGDMAVRVKTAADKLAREAVAATGTFQRMNDSLDRVATGLHAIADQRRAATAIAARDADCSAIAHYQSVSPAAVQAANRARWGRA